MVDNENITHAYELVSEISKEVDEEKVNSMLKNNWMLLSVGNMIQVSNVRDGNEMRRAIGQAPYYILGKIRGH